MRMMRGVEWSVHERVGNEGGGPGNELMGRSDFLFKKGGDLERERVAGWEVRRGKIQDDDVSYARNKGENFEVEYQFVELGEETGKADKDGDSQAQLEDLPSSKPISFAAPPANDPPLDFVVARPSMLMERVMKGI